MKKITKAFTKGVVSLVIGISSIGIVYGNESNVQDFSISLSEEHQEIVDALYRLENKNVQIKEIYQLYDVNELPNFILVEFYNSGYAIVTNGTFELNEYSLEQDAYIPYINSNIESNLWIYGGPFNYILKNDYQYLDARTLNKLNFSPEESLIKLSEDIVNGELEKEVDNLITPYATQPTSWTGIASSRFTRYTNSGWQNNDSTCGPHAAGIMLAYYQDYLPSLVAFNSNVRTKDSTSAGTLITKLKSSTSSPTSTLPQDVAVGTATFLNNYNNAKSYITCFSSAGGTWNTATNKISSSRPVCIGLSGAGGLHKYGWHWVTAYAYGTDADGNGYYRCNDNWGASAVTIRTSWTIGIAYLNQ